MLEQIWERALTTQPAPSPTALLVLALLALLVTWSPVGHRVVRHLVTLLHEAGHAAVGVLAGRRVHGIRLHADTSGLTLSRGRARGPGMVLMLLAGYPAPALVGLGAAALLSRGYAVGLLWALVLLCGVVLLLVRNVYGLLVVVVTGAGVAVLSWVAEPRLLSWVAAALVWVVLLGAPRSVVELQRHRRRGARGSDVDQLAGLTGVPAVLWVALFWLVAVACLGAAGWLLLR
ncbi:M50 family metallopeptidase [Ornithinimicrobium sp. W1665]|uniref:M50 family metallopeptidase n=1 Tax=Ornithinimicrobium sp. W1665 TaxID=3416666 RepID=UPI003CF9F308